MEPVPEVGPKREAHADDRTYDECDQHVKSAARSASSVRWCSGIDDGQHRRIPHLRDSRLFIRLRQGDIHFLLKLHAALESSLLGAEQRRFRVTAIGLQGLKLRLLRGS